MKNENFNSFKQESEEIDFKKILRFILLQSKLVLTITSVVFIIALLSNILATKEYRIQSLIQYETFNQNILDPSSVLQPSFGGGSKTDIMNLVTLYKSRTNILKLIKDLKLNIDVKGLSANESIDINIESLSKNIFQKQNLNFSFSDNGYSLLDSNQNQLASSNYGENIYFNELAIKIHSSKIFENKIVEVDFRHPESMFNELNSKIVLSSSTGGNSFLRNDGLITVSYVTDNTELGKKIVDYANDIFLNQRISVESEKSKKALEFINKNLKSLEDDFENKKIKLNSFREKNQSIDVDLEIRSVVNKIEVLEQSLSSIDLAIVKAKEIYTKNNPVFLNLLNEKKIIEKQKDDVMSVIKLMPKEQQEYIDLYNDVEVSQVLFEELESRRLALSILEASTIGDIRIVDNAYYVNQVSPKFSFVILSTLFSLLAAFFIAVVRGFLFLPISNPAELSDNSINFPILGVIPRIDDIQDNQDNINLITSMESIIVNIDSLRDNQLKNMITITSPGPSNGKSMASMQLAKAYASLGKKVLLIDGDFKRGKLAKNFNVRSIDKEAFISIDETNVEDFIISKNLYLIPRIKNLTNSFEFLYNTAFKEKVDFLKSHFDYIILDTAPILSIADTSILIEKSDFNILIVRHDVNRISQIKQAMDHFGQIDKAVDGIVYNGYEKPKNSYGYYGLYGNYAYQYYAEKYLEDVYDYKK